MFHKMLKAAIVAGAMLVPGVAAAASAAIVTTDLNIRTGPGAQYQRFGTIPAGGRVAVYGCLSGYNWCDVDWSGTRGWVSGSYLAYRETRGAYYDRPVSSVGISIGIPVIGFDAYSYHDRYYRGRSWYRDRYLDRGDWRPDRPHERRDWRDARRDDWRDGRRDDRRDWRDGRRDDRRDWREGRRDDRRDDRRDRRPVMNEDPARVYNVDPNRDPDLWYRVQRAQREQR